MASPMLKLLKELPIIYCASEQTARSLIIVERAACVPTVVRSELFSAPIFHVCFDYDSILITADGDRMISEKGREYFSKHEWENRKIVHKEGPLLPVLKKVQKIPNAKISIVTCRNEEESHRMFTTIEHWGLDPSCIFPIKNKPKGIFLEKFKVDFFFDNILKNIEDAVRHGVNAAWVPYGDGNI